METKDSILSFKRLMNTSYYEILKKFWVALKRFSLTFSNAHIILHSLYNSNVVMQDRRLQFAETH